MALYTASYNLLAKFGNPKCQSIKLDDNKVAVGLAPYFKSIPRCLAPYSNKENDLPILTPGAIPGPPTSELAILAIIEPYKLGKTITSNYQGFETICMLALSIIISSYFI